MGLSGPTPGGNISLIGRRDVLALAASAAVGGMPDLARAAGPVGQLIYGVHISLAPTWFEPAETPALITPYMLLLRAARCHGEADARRAAGACLAEVLVGDRRRHELQFVLREGVDVPQRRAGDRGGREILLRALPRRGEGSAEGPGCRGRDRPMRGMSHFKLKNPWPDFLTFYAGSHRRGLDRAEEICREGRRRRLQEGADRRRAVQVRLVQPGRRTGARGVRELLAQDAEREAPGAAGDPRRGDAAGGAEARRDRYRLFDPRRAGRGAAADAGADAEAGGHPVAVLAVLPGTVGCEVAVA